jgi:hypothetical protein
MAREAAMAGEERCSRDIGNDGGIECDIAESIMRIWRAEVSGDPGRS